MGILIGLMFCLKAALFTVRYCPESFFAIIRRVTSFRCFKFLQIIICYAIGFFGFTPGSSYVSLKEGARPDNIR